MAVRVLVLLSLVSAGSAFEADSDFVTSVTAHLHEYLVSELRSFVHEHATPQLALVSLKEDTSGAACGKCVQMATKFVLGHAEGKMKDVCAKVSPHSCITSKVCEMMGKHPKVTLGMMVEHVRPASLAIAYCFGKGACKKSDNATMDEMVMGEENHQGLLDSFDEVDWSEVQEQTEELTQLSDDNAEMASETSRPPCEEHRHRHMVSPFCMKRAMRHVMGHAIRKVKGMCAHSKCPKMKRVCRFMAQHKEVAFGVLVAKVEPWKFAFGFCRAREMSHHHHHGHHGWPHHGHHGHHDWPHHRHHGREASESRREADESRREADESRREADEDRREADEDRREGDYGHHGHHGWPHHGHHGQHHWPHHGHHGNRDHHGHHGHHGDDFREEGREEASVFDIVV